MEISEILKRVDHTLLKQTATFDDIKAICDDAMKYATATVCIPPCFVAPTKAYVGNRLKICTVIGFPNGYNTTAVKCFEAKQAVNDGADEIDMVINIGMVKSLRYDDVLTEINEVKSSCEGRLLKVIIETCMLTEDEKIKLCNVVTKSNADYIKTSTGFGGSGATFEDIELFSKYVGNNTKIKASGGITSLEDAERFIALGADRLGTSRIVKLVKEKKA